MESQALENPVRLLSREGFVERARSMRRQIIQHYAEKIAWSSPSNARVLFDVSLGARAVSA